MSVWQRCAELPRQITPTLSARDSVDRTLVVLGAVTFVGQSVVIRSTPRVTGYETSLLATVPLPFWLCFSICLGGTILGLIHTGLRRGQYLMHFMSLLVANYAILLFLPVFQGYRLYGRGQADKLYHLAQIAEILETGGFDSLFYPVTHVFVAELSALSGLSPRLSAITTSLLLSLLYVVSIGVVLRACFRDPEALPLGMAASAPFLFGNFYVSVTPAILSFFFVPLMLFALERYRRQRTRRALALVVLFAVLLVPFHPVSALFLVALLATTTVYTNIVGRFKHESIQQLPHFLWSGLLLLVVVWYGQFRSTRYFVGRIVEAWLYGANSIAGSKAEQAREASLTTTELAVRAVQLYGAIAVYVVLFAVFVCYGVYRLAHSNHHFAREYISMQAGIGAVLAVTFLFGYFVAFNIVRVSRYYLLFATLAVGGLLVISQRSEYASSITALLTVCILLSAALSVSTVYPVNNHMTVAEFEGSAYALSVTDDGSDIHSLNTNEKMEMYVTGETDTGDHTFVGDSTTVEELLAGTAPSTNGSDGVYLATKSYDTELYTSEYYFDSQQELLRVVTEAKERRLNRRPGVQRLYSNGGYVLWYISAPDGSGP